MGKYHYSLTLCYCPTEIMLFDCHGAKDLKNTEDFTCIEHERLLPIAKRSAVNGQKDPKNLNWKLMEGIWLSFEENGKTKEIELATKNLKIAKVLKEKYKEDNIKTPTTLLWKILFEAHSISSFELDLEEEFDINKLGFIQNNYFDEKSSYPFKESYIDAGVIIYDGKEYREEDGDTKFAGGDYSKILSLDSNGHSKTIIDSDDINWSEDDWNQVYNIWD